MSVALRTVSVVDAVTEGLRSAILSGEIQPGTPISEAALTERFGVPRPTVRSAILLVMQDGLLRREPNRSVYVPRLTSDDIRDVFAVRRLIEFDTITKIVENKLYPSAAMRTLRMMEALDDNDGWDEYVRLDVTLHQDLVATMGSPRLSRYYGSIAAELQLALTQLRVLYSSKSTIADEHREFLEAICSHDIDAAMAVAHVHIDDSEQLILGILAEQNAE